MEFIQKSGGTLITLITENTALHQVRTNLEIECLIKIIDIPQESSLRTFKLGFIATEIYWTNGLLQVK